MEDCLPYNERTIQAYCYALWICKCPCILPRNDGRSIQRHGRSYLVARRHSNFRGETGAEHQRLVQQVLQGCVQHGLALNLSKSEFYVKETILLGHIINGSQIQMDHTKLETMSKWPVPTKKKEVQAFLGFANYYRRFIENYSGKARPLINLTKDVPCSCRE